jgi:hypothetical protein
MKNKYSLLLLSSLILLTTSCKKQEEQIFFEGGTEPVLTASSTAAMVLTKSNENNFALRFNWTNPDYRTTTGISSHDVTYYIQADTTGSNFTNPNMAQISISKDLSKEFTVKELNMLFGATQLKLVENIPHNIEFRIKATLVGTAVPRYSNVIKMTITPYLDVAVALPIGGRLFLVGDATPGAWANPVPLPSQEFTKLSNTSYQITIPLIGNKKFLFLPVNGSWDNKYACNNGNTQPLSGGAFGYNGGNSFYNSDMPGPASDGTYKITVDFITGTYTVVKL